MLIASRFLAYFAAGGLQPVLQVILAKIVPHDQRGTYFGWTNSMSQAGGILCSFISGGIALLGSVRGIFAAAGLILFLMVPLMIPARRACEQAEKQLNQAS
jgi:MFS family permease